MISSFRDSSFRAAEDAAAEAHADRVVAAREAAWLASPAGRASEAERRRRHQAARIRAMADVMLKFADAGGCCVEDLRRCGFAAAEIARFKEPALQIARSERPGLGLEAA